MHQAVLRVMERAGETVWWSGACEDLHKGLGSIPSTHMMAHYHVYIQCLLLASLGNMHIHGAQTHLQAKLSHIKTNVKQEM